MQREVKCPPTPGNGNAVDMLAQHGDTKEGLGEDHSRVRVYDFGVGLGFGLG